MVGYLLVLLQEGALAGPTMLMRWASMTGFHQILPPISSYSSEESRSRDAPEDEELDVPTEA
jgi:hypothetical protein